MADTRLEVLRRGPVFVDALCPCQLFIVGTPLSLIREYLVGKQKTVDVSCFACSGLGRYDDVSLSNVLAGNVSFVGVMLIERMGPSRQSQSGHRNTV